MSFTNSIPKTNNSKQLLIANGIPTQIQACQTGQLDGRLGKPLELVVGQVQVKQALGKTGGHIDKAIGGQVQMLEQWDCTRAESIGLNLE